MSSEIEYKFIGDYIEGLSKTENPSLTDKTLVCNETDGPRYVPANPEDLTNVATEADMTANAKLRIKTPDGEKQLAANLVAKQSDVTSLQTKTGNISASMAPSFSSVANYSAGEVVNEGDVLYKFFDDHSAGAWTGSDAVETSLARELNRVDTKWIPGYRINPNGALEAGSGYEYSDYIPIPEEGLFVSSYLFTYSCIAFYDGLKNFIGYHNVTSGPNILHEETLTRNDFDGSAYVRVTNYYTGYKGRGVWRANLENSLSSDCKGFKATKNYLAGDVVSNDGSLYKFFSDHSAGAWTGSDAVETNIMKEIERADTAWIQGIFISSAGAQQSFSGYEASDYIAIPLGGLKVSAYLFENTGIAYYNESKTFIGFKAGTGSTNTLHELQVTREDFAGAVFVRVDNYKNSYSGRYVKFLNLKFDFHLESFYKNVNAVGEFASNKGYGPGELVLHLGTLYKLKDSHTSGNAWSATNAVATTLANEFNRVDKKWIVGKFINNSGTEVLHNDYECSDYIAIPVSGLTVTAKLFTNTGFIFYDKDKNFIGTHPGETGTLAQYTEVVTRNTFQGAAYVRMSNPKNNANRGAWLANTYIDVGGQGEQEEQYCHYKGGEASTFSKGVAIGDSLTRGTFNYNYPDGQLIHVIEDAKYSWPTFFKKLSGVDMTNKGTGGATPESWYSAHSSDDLSGHDFAVIALGVNCAFHDHGGWTSDSDLALKDIISKLETENEGIKVFVCTIFASTSYTSAMMDSINDGIRTSVAEIQETDDNVYLLDLDEYGTTKQTKYWHGHATATGYRQIANDIYNYISYVMSQDMAAFKFVQFIGTQYEP